MRREIRTRVRELVVAGVFVTLVSLAPAQSAADTGVPPKSGTPTVIHPRDVSEAMKAQESRLRAAKDGKRVSICDLDFEAFPEGRLGKGVHGETVLNGALLLGYDCDGRIPFGDTLHAAIASVRGNKVLQLVDREPRATIYAKLNLERDVGGVSFDLKVPRVTPLSITLCAYEMVLVVPSGDQWEQWFPNTPYRAAFIYLEGTGAGYSTVPANRNNYRAVDTGIVVEPDKWYAILVEWDHSKRLASITIDRKRVVDHRPFLSGGFQTTESIVWVTSSFNNQGSASPTEILLDNIHGYTVLHSVP